MAGIERIEIHMVDLKPKTLRTDAIQRFDSQETPIVRITDSDGAPLGIVSTADLARRVKDETLVKRIMTTQVTVVPAYNDVSAAARIMRRRKIHHVVVTHEKKVCGIISSFDLLKLVEGHRFVPKNAPSRTAKARRAR